MTTRYTVCLTKYPVITYIYSINSHATNTLFARYVKSEVNSPVVTIHVFFDNLAYAVCPLGHAPAVISKVVSINNKQQLFVDLGREARRLVRGRGKEGSMTSCRGRQGSR